MQTAAYLRNRVPNRGQVSTTPYTEWFGKKPSVTHLHIFGAKAFVRIPDAKRHKLDPKSTKCIFVGYDQNTDHVYRVYDPEKKKVDRVSDVIIEDIGAEDNCVLFPLTPDDSGEADEEFDEDGAEKISSSEDVWDVEDISQESVQEIRRGVGRPKGSKNKPRVIPDTDRLLRSDKKANINAMMVSLDPVSFEDAMSRDDCGL